MGFSQEEARIRGKTLREQGLKLCPKPDCPAAGIPQPFAAFFKKASRADGLSGWCKVCWTRNTSANRTVYAQTGHGEAVLRAQYERRVQSGKMAEAKERHRLSGKLAAASAVYDRSPAGRASRARYKANNLAKVRARATVNNAIQVGKLLPAVALPCASCGGASIDYHHHLGYAPEHHLSVVALCRQCHEAMHHQTEALASETAVH